MKEELIKLEKKCYPKSFNIMSHYRNNSVTFLQGFLNMGLMREEAELLLLRIGGKSKEISQIVGKIDEKIGNEFDFKFIECFDSALKKIVSYEGVIVKNFPFNLNIEDFDFDEEIEKIDYFATSFQDPWEAYESYYIIKTLPKEFTKAHAIYLAYNHGDEGEVLFERNSKFKVKDSALLQNKAYIYLDEIL